MSYYLLTTLLEDATDNQLTAAGGIAGGALGIRSGLKYPQKRLLRRYYRRPGFQAQVDSYAARKGRQIAPGLQHAQRLINKHASLLRKPRIKATIGRGAKGLAIGAGGAFLASRLLRPRVQESALTEAAYKLSVHKTTKGAGLGEKIIEYLRKDARKTRFKWSKGARKIEVAAAAKDAERGPLLTIGKDFVNDANKMKLTREGVVKATKNITTRKLLPIPFPW